MIRTIFPMSTEYDSNLPLVVKGIGVQNNQEHISRPFGFPYYHWAHCTKGEGNLIIGGNTYKISEGMGFFFQPGIPHEYYATKEPWQINWIIFEGSALPQLLIPLGLEKWSVLMISNFQTIHLLLKDISICLSSESPNKIIEASSLLYQFLVKLKNSTSPGNKDANDKYKQLIPVISYMENNYNNFISLEEMAAIIGVTPYHLCRLFKQAFKTSPFKYLIKLRIQKAKEFLVEIPQMSIKDISEKVGYHDTSYFCNIFKVHEGITPSEFRRMHRNI